MASIPAMDRVWQISRQYTLGYLQQKARADQDIDQIQSLDREVLAQSDPALAKILESQTRDDQEQSSELWATSFGVAHAILYALGETSEL